MDRSRGGGRRARRAHRLGRRADRVRNPHVDPTRQRPRGRADCMVCARRGCRTWHRADGATGAGRAVAAHLVVARGPGRRARTGGGHDRFHPGRQRGTRAAPAPRPPCRRAAVRGDLAGHAFGDRAAPGARAGASPLPALVAAPRPRHRCRPLGALLAPRLAWSRPLAGRTRGPGPAPHGRGRTGLHRRLARHRRADRGRRGRGVRGGHRRGRRPRPGDRPPGAPRSSTRSAGEI